MHRSNWRLRARWERVLALAFTSLFGWIFVLAPTAAAVAQYRIPNTQHPGAGFRRLSDKEMARIKGAQHALSFAAASGTAYPWEGSVGGTNTGDGNKLTSIPIVGWTQRGGLPVDMVLYHNSQGNHNSELGAKWTHSFDIYMVSIAPGGGGGCAFSDGPRDAGAQDAAEVASRKIDKTCTANDMVVHWGDDLSYKFTNDGSNNFTAPTGIHETLVLNVDGTFTLTKPDQTKYHFNTSYYCDTITDENSNAITITIMQGTMLQVWSMLPVVRLRLDTMEVTRLRP